MVPNLYKNTDDFMECSQRGIRMIEKVESPPDEADLESMRSLLAMVMTATMNIDGDPELPMKISAWRMALLAAYNLGKHSADN
jgi:hypothetical protein